MSFPVVHDLIRYRSSVLLLTAFNHHVSYNINDTHRPSEVSKILTLGLRKPGAYQTAAFVSRGTFAPIAYYVSEYQHPQMVELGTNVGDHHQASYSAHSHDVTVFHQHIPFVLDV